MVSTSAGERLRVARMASYLRNVNAAAKATGVAVPTLYHHENGTRQFSAEQAERYAAAFKVDAAWLLLGEPRRVPLSEEWREDRAVDDLGAVGEGWSPESWRSKVRGALPEIDVQAGAGEGAVGEMMTLSLGGESYSGHRIIGEWLFPEDYLRTEINASVSKTMVMPVRGDSMEPTYRPGDRVLVDLSQKTLTEDTVYVISDGQSAPRIKRLVEVMFSRPRKVKIVSDNPAIESQEVHLEDVAIIGRVVGVVSRR